MTEEEALKRALERERDRRRSAELLLEEKSRELFESFEALDKAHTALKQNQKLLIRNEKMASLGIMSAGVAHEINNPVGFALSNMQLLEKNFPLMRNAMADARALLRSVSSDEAMVDKVAAFEAQLLENDIEYQLEDAPDLMSETIDGLRRIQEIVISLGSVVREDSSDRIELDVNEELRCALAQVSDQFTANTTIIEKYSEIPVVLGSKTEFGRVFMNLLRNAIDAMAGVERVQHELSVGTHVVDDCVRAYVEDSGCGMSAEVQKKLFTPFFTTKEVGQGIGLGLAVSFGIMEDHGGTIEFKSVPGEGSRFELSVPIP